MSSFRVDNLASGYGSKTVVNNISFEIVEGEFCALLGLNGCGKSTLIKTLCGLIKTSDGILSLNEQNILNLDDKTRARLVAYIPQRGSSIYNRTALDVVLMGFNPRMSLFENYSNKQIEIAKRSMEKIGILSFENKLFEELSEGQKQLVILARTIVQDTKIVLMDEPDSALDFSNKNIVLQKIGEMINERKKIGLIALHDPNIALMYCDRLFLMKNETIINIVEKEEFGDYDLLQKNLSEIYGEIRVIDNSGKPVVVSNAAKH